MKKIILFLFLAILLAGCNRIPNKSVFEDLTTDELTKAIKSDAGFGDFYEEVRGWVKSSTLSRSQKAQYKDITYRKLYQYYMHAADSAFWAPKEKEWAAEWDNTMGKDLKKVDQTMQYWADYKAQNSLERFADIQLSNFHITHYAYIGGVEDAYICFTIIPKEGEIEQIKFTYSYSYKINEGQGKQTRSCICTTPISEPFEAMWEIGYSEKERFDGMTVSKFDSIFDLEIVITNVRKDGVNYSIDDLEIPEAVTNLWNEDSSANREEVAKLINPSYISQTEYVESKKDEEMKNYDEHCHSLLAAFVESESEDEDIFMSIFD